MSTGRSQICTTYHIMLGRILSEVHYGKQKSTRRPRISAQDVMEQLNEQQVSDQESKEQESREQHVEDQHRQETKELVGALESISKEKEDLNSQLRAALTSGHVNVTALRSSLAVAKEEIRGLMVEQRLKTSEQVDTTRINESLWYLAGGLFLYCTGMSVALLYALS